MDVRWRRIGLEPLSRRDHVLRHDTDVHHIMVVKAKVFAEALGLKRIVDSDTQDLFLHHRASDVRERL